MIFRRAAVVLFLTLLSGSFCWASQYTYGGNGIYFDASGAAYTRSSEDNGDYYWNGCKWVWRSSYTYTYTPLKLNLAAPNAESQIIALAAAKQKAADLRALADKLGVSVAPSPFGYSSAYSYGNPLLGNFGANGNTLYGYSYSQYADLYGSTDVNSLLQQSSSLVKNAQALSGQAHTEFSGVANTVLAGQKQLAEIREQGESTRKALEGLVNLMNASKAAPQANVQTNVGAVPGPNTVTPAVMPRIDGGDTRPLMSATAKTSCFACHSGASAKGGLDMSKGLTADQFLKVINRVSLPASDPKHMPQLAGGAPGRQLNSQEMKDLLP